MTKNFVSNQVYESIYISDKALYEIINNYCQNKYDDPSITFEQFVNREDTGIADESNKFYNTCVKYVDFLNDGQKYGNEVLDDVVGNIGNISSLVGVILLDPAAPAVAGVIVTCLGAGTAVYSFYNQIFNWHLENQKQEFINALYEGKFNFKIENLDVSTYIPTLQYNQYKSFSSWDTNYYINKISDGKKISDDIVYDIEPFNIYTAAEQGDGTWRLIP